MTLLLGDNNFTAYSGLGPASADGGYVPAAPFVAPQSGLVTSLNCWLTPGTPTDAFVMGLYDGVSQRLIYSAPVVPGVAGQVNFPVNPTPVVAFRAYQILLISSSAAFQFGIDGSLPTRAFKVGNAASIYPAAAYQLTGPSPTTFGAPAFYADGDAQASTLLASSTVGQTVFDTATVIARAFNRCRIRSAVISDEMIQKALDELYLILMGLANGPTPLWAIDRILLPFTQGQAGVSMPTGTVDAKSVNYRFMNPLQTGPASMYSPSSPTQVNTVAVTWSASAVPIQIQMSQTGSSWSTLVTATPNASPGQTTVYDLDGAIPAPFWRVIANPVPPGKTLSVSSVVFYGTLYEVPMAPYSRDEYSQLPNRAFPGTPRQYWFERIEPQPVIHFWPVPLQLDQTSACAVIWRHRHVMDVGTLTQRVECPQRWLPAIIDMLAESLNRIIPEADIKLLPTNQAYAAKSLAAAKSEERERGPMKIVPSISRYTR